MEKEIRTILSEINIQDLPQYGLENYVLNTMNWLKSRGRYTLSDLLEFDVNQEKGKLAERIKSWQSFVTQNAQQIVSDWEEMQNLKAVKKIPSSYDPSLGFVANLKNTIVEYAQIIQKRISNERYAKKKKNYEQSHKNELLCAQILLLAYEEGKDDDSIINSLPENYKQDTIKRNRINRVWKLYKGYTKSEGFEIDPDMLAVAKSLEDECLFKSIKVYDNYSGDTKHEFLEEFGFTFVEINNDSIVVPSFKKGDYKKVYKRACEILNDIIFPEYKEVLIEKIEESDDLKDIDYDPSFITNLLDNKSFVDVLEDGLVQIKNQYLTTTQKRYIRIIYNAKENLTVRDIRKRYEEEYGKEPSAWPARDEQYKICTDGTFWYYGEPRVPVRRAIVDYVEDHIIFNFSDLKQHLQKQGYSFNPDTIRTYITNLCSVDNKDHDHFCHIDFIDEHSSYSWKKPQKYGFTNWMLKTTKSILGEKEEISWNELVSKLTDKAKGTEYAENIKKQAKSVIYKYSGDGNPFMFEKKQKEDEVEEKYIRKNEPFFSEADFDTIGLRGVKYAYFKQIRAIAANEVRKDESGKKSLKDIVSIVNEITDEPLSRNTILRAIKNENRRFEPIDVEVVKENGVLYVQWTKKDIVPEPVYVVKSSADTSENEDVIEVSDVEPRPEIKYRQEIDWEKLKSTMKNELEFYGRWMEYDNINMNSAIDDFTQFLSMAHNTNLSQRLPMDLYEYWFACTDSLDRSRYLTDILIFFEATLKEMLLKNLGVDITSTKGLLELAQYFEGLPSLLLYSRDSKGFHRIASELHSKRNLVAHGECLNIGSRETAKLITDFVALYVYVVAKYYHQS